MNFVFFLDLLAVFLQFLAAWFSFRIYKFNRLSRWWLALIFAFLLQGLRRAVQAYSDIAGISMNLYLDRFLAFFISLLIVIGLWTMMRNFENFEIVEKNVKRSVNR